MRFIYYFLISVWYNALAETSQPSFNAGLKLCVLSVFVEVHGLELRVGVALIPKIEVR